MTRDTGRRHVQRPAVEPLEGRPLLSTFYPGLTAVDPVQTAGGTYTLTISGPGVERVRRAPHGQIAVTLLGTTSATTLKIALTRPRFHVAASPLQIASIKVNSGQLGGIEALGTADLNGAMTPLNNPVNAPVNTLQFADLGPKAQIDVNGSLGSLGTSGAINLGPGGQINVTDNLTQGLSARSINLAGGQINIGNDLAGPISVSEALSTTSNGRFVVGHDVTGSLSLGSLNLDTGGQFLVANDVAGLVGVTGGLSITNNSLFSIGHNLVGGLSVGQGLTLDSGGQLSVGNDLSGPIRVGGDLSISNSARLIVNRDVTGSITVAGNLELASGGALTIDRNLNALTVNGNLSVMPGGALTVGGNLTNLTVNGALVGQGSATATDLNVGLNLGALNVLGGGANQGGIQSAKINVDKSILSLNVTHGIFNSLITVGVTINGGSPSSTAPSIGPDGDNAVLNSQILAGSSIVNLLIGGNVDSTFATNPASTGYPTRIVAGEYPQNGYVSAGLIDNFQITGSLIDSVLAASVAPYGGDGTLPTTAYGTPPPDVGPPPPGQPNTYDAPAGTITGGTVGAPIKYPNDTELSYYNETLTGVSWNTTLSPTIDDTILPAGSINPSFASAPLSSSALTQSVTTYSSIGGVTTSTTTTPNDQVLPLPTKPTVLGSVISTAHGQSADFAGIFAANTSGVFVGAAQ